MNNTSNLGNYQRVKEYLMDNNAPTELINFICGKVKIEMRKKGRRYGFKESVIQELMEDAVKR